jgi:beta-hydroxylase
MTLAIVLGIFFLTTLYIHNRGKKKLKIQQQILDHSTFFSPLNCLMYASSSVPTTPFIDLKHFPELKLLQDNWEIIRDEAVALSEAQKIASSDKYNDVGFNSFFRRGWKRFYLKWYQGSLPSAEKMCPKTIELLNQIPYIKGAMFASLPADSFLFPHRDPYAGSLRYHLGLVTPNDDQCNITVDEENYSWRDGEAVVFDETYVHHAKNDTETNRIILFCDLERPVNNFFAKGVNKVFSFTLARATASPNTKEDKTGLLNRIFGLVYPIRIGAKKIKAFSRPLYYFLKYLLIGLALYAIIF